MTQSNQQPTVTPVRETTASESTPVRKPSWIAPLSGLGGLACFILAQQNMLHSRNPLIPSALYIVGFLVLLPFLNRMNAPHDEDYRFESAARQKAKPVKEGGNRGLPVASGDLSLPEPDVSTSGDLNNSDNPLISWRGEAVVVISLMLIALLLYLPLPLPPITLSRSPENGPLWAFITQSDAAFPPDSSYLQVLSRLFAWFFIPAVYLFGRVLVGRLTGFFAAGFATTGLWGLALSQGGTVSSVLAMGSALFLAALFYALHYQRIGQNPASRLAKFRWLIVLMILAIGVMMSPLFGYLEILLLLALALACFELRHRIGRIIGYALIAITLALTLIPLMGNFPGLLPRPQIPDLYIEKVGVSSLVATADGLSSSLLLFNLTSDPDPAHGIIDRPAFAPIMAGAFVVGLLGWLWRLVDHRRPLDWLLLIALVVGMLPSALYIVPPLRYPHLGWAALALPVGLVLAAWGLSRIALLLELRWGRWGWALAIGLYLLALVLIAQDTRQHYVKVFLPIRDRATSTSGVDLPH